jgi:hypothetical protein
VEIREITGLSLKSDEAEKTNYPMYEYLLARRRREKETCAI